MVAQDAAIPYFLAAHVPVSSDLNISALKRLQADYVDIDWPELLEFRLSANYSTFKPPTPTYDNHHTDFISGCVKDGLAQDALCPPPPSHTRSPSFPGHSTIHS